MEIEFMNKSKTVVTISGKEVPRTSAIENKKNGTFYEKNVDCFKIKDNSPKGEQWYKIDSGKIGYCIETESWNLLEVLRSEPEYVEGIIGLKNETGFFSKKRNNHITAYEEYNKRVPVFILNKELAEQLGYLPCLWDELWYKKSRLSEKELIHISTPQVKRYKSLPFDYNANKKNNSFLKILDIYKHYEPNIDIRTKEVTKYLYQTSFGIELESNNGTLLEKDLGNLGLVPLKDGSLRKPDGTEPYEYTTVPLSDAKGLETLKSICKELQTRCTFDETCSLHIHIGNIKWDRLTIIAYYVLIQRLQNEIYKIVPMYKRDEIKYAKKQKCYNQPLPNLGLLSTDLYKKEYANNKEFEKAVKEYFNLIVKYLCNNQIEGETSDYNLEKAEHPLGQQKWNIQSRKNYYCALN